MANIRQYYVYLCRYKGKKEYAPCKIGVTDNPKERLTNLQTGNDKELIMEYKQKKTYWDVKNEQNAKYIEDHILEKYKDNANREWITKISIINIIEDIINYINDLD